MRQLTQEEIMMGNAAFTSRLNVIHHAYVDICGDLIAGSLLSQILYWFGADRNGRPRARIQKDGYLWIAKARSDWWDEIRISPKQYDRAARILVEKKFIEVRTLKFNGNPTTHIRIISETLNKAISKWKYDRALEQAEIERQKLVAVGFSPYGNNEMTQTASTYLPDGTSPNYPMGNYEMPESGISLTEITTETKSKTTAENTHTKRACVLSFSDIWDAYPKKTGRSKAERAFNDAIAKGANAFAIYAEVVLFAQYIHAMIDHEGLEWRYVPTGGVWFVEERWNDDTRLIGKYLGFDDGMEYNRHASRLRALTVHALDQDETEQAETLAAMHGIMSKFPY